MTTTLIIAALITFLAAFVRAASGFGQALIAGPLLTFILETKAVVVLNAFLAAIGTAFVLFRTWRHVDVKRMLFIGLGSIMGIPLGAYLLVILDPLIIKLIMAILVIISSVLLLLGHTHHFRRDTLGCVIAGFLSGVVQGSTSLGGPPVVLYLLNQGLAKERFVGTLAGYFLLMGVLSAVAFSSINLVTTDLLIMVAWLLIPLWFGTYFGIKLLPRINVLLFKRLASLVLSATALAVLITVLMEL